MKPRENFADDSALQFTLREMRRLLNRWQFWMVLAVLIALLTLSGPFGTLDDLGAAQRFAYWSAIAVLTSLPSFFIAFAVNWIGVQKSWNQWTCIAMAGLIGAIPVTLIVWFISAFLAQNRDATLAGFLEIGLRCLPISLGITAVYTLLNAQNIKRRWQGETEPIATPQVPFLKRLSPETGTVITTLQAQDHYVEVTTTRGSELVLVRLADAERELEGIDGMRVHRSWWVARDAVASTKRLNGKLVLALNDGREVPVSRANERAVRGWVG
ncbi:MAG: LytTR family DNA-binding domain-containing protein [Pseudomonadota bacterium]